MNGDDDIVNAKDLEPDGEKLTHNLIETLRCKRVCLFPGPRLPIGPRDFEDFGECLPYVGDCGALIFCAPGHDKEWAQAKIQYYVNSGDFDLAFDRNKCVGVENDWLVSDLFFPLRDQKLLIARNDEVLFPRRSQELLVAPKREPQPTKPPDHQFWARYIELSIFGREDSLHVLHIGLCGDDTWLYFMIPHGIEAARIITTP